MGCKVVETICNNNTTRGLGTANEHTVQWWFKKFCKGDKSLEEEEHSGIKNSCRDCSKYSA